MIAAAAWPLAVLSLIYRVAAATGQPGYDLRPVYGAVRAFLHHVNPYTTVHFVYPPSVLLLSAPLGLLSFATARDAFVILDATCMVAAAAVCLDLFGISPRAPLGATLLLGLTIFAPFVATLELANANGPVLLGEVLFLRWSARGRWDAGAVALGLTFAIKPVLPLLILLPLLAGRWRAVAIAVALPLGLALPALALSHGATDFFSVTVPLLLNGNSPEFAPYNLSLAGAGAMLGLPVAVTLGLRAAVAAVAAAAAWLRWRRGGDERLRLVEVAGLLLAGTFACFSFSWGHYALFLLPLLVSVAAPVALMRAWPAWVAVYLFGSLDVWSTPRLGHTAQVLGHVRPTLGYLLLIGVFAWYLRPTSRRADRATADN